MYLLYLRLRVVCRVFTFEGVFTVFTFEGSMLGIYV